MEHQNQEINITLEVQGQTYKGTLYRQNLQAPSPPSEPPKITLENVRKMLVEHEEVLEISDKEDHIQVRTREYLKDKDQWKAINSQIKFVGGTWVGAGKDSRWEIPK